MPTASLVRSFGFGFIALWFGSLASIPVGWALCDGTQGTPNLRDRFVRGAGDTYNPNDIGGDIEHTHDFTSDTHRHLIGAGSGLMVPGLDQAITDLDIATGTTDNANSLPPYKSLTFIMEL